MARIKLSASSNPVKKTESDIVTKATSENGISKEKEENNKEDRKASLIQALKKCEVVLDGDVVSNELIVEVASRFLVDTIKESHTSSVFLHTGSIVYDAIAFVLLALINIIFDENDIDDKSGALEVGSVVSYEGDKKNLLYIYKGNSDRMPGMIELVEVKDPTGKRFISQNSIGKLVPYYGKATDIKGRGVRTTKSKRMEFLSDILELDASQITATAKLSTVVMIDNEKLDYLLDNIILNFVDKDKTYELLDLVTVTYYTDTKEFRKKGNASNVEPAIKATNSILRARELVIDRDQNDVIGFVALNAKSYKKGLNDFESLFRRRKLRYSWLIAPIEKNQLLEGLLDSDAEMLSLTPNIIRNMNVTFTPNNDTSLSLYKELESVAYRRIRYEVVNSTFKWSQYKKVRTTIKYLLDNSGDDINVIQFARWAYSMLKLLNMAFFDIKEYEDNARKLGLETREEIIAKQKEIIVLFADYLQDKANEVLTYISSIYQDFCIKNPKKDYIKKYVFDKGYNRILFVVPGRNYEQICDSYIKSNMRFRNFKYRITTESRVKDMQLSSYDCVIFPALLNYDAINPYSLMSANEVVIFIYDTQIRLCKFLEREFHLFVKRLEEKCPSELTEKIIYEDDAILSDSKEIETIVEEDTEEHVIDDVFRNMFLQAEMYQSREYFLGGGTREKGIEVCRYAQCDSGEKLLFSKGYTAYVVDSLRGEVVEKDVDAIEAGDQLIFTINDDKTKDIVDDLLCELCDRNEEVNDAYKLVKRWKEDFRELKDSNDWTYVDIVKMFDKAGCVVTAQTIRQWIDEDSHIVGPKEKEMFIYIGRVLCDKEVEENYQRFAEATQVVRRIRTRILKLIQSVVVDDLNGSKQIEEKMFADMIDEIRKIAIIRQIEHIENIEPFKISINRANRPLDM
ncbi:DrmE family protein [Butyrivibrio sp. XBB1001]|uniref:DrmE family protein n=1 Tax=Butyrivibrio sp. XBB1001 TaxID=1280682 RepID=UPI000407E2B2|nr:DrmE family protein [Butyrivibrio sp. XBB1001]